MEDKEGRLAAVKRELDRLKAWSAAGMAEEYLKWRIDLAEIEIREIEEE